MSSADHASETESDVAALLARLQAEHALLDGQIEQLNRRLYLSSREQMERRRLQKLKLATKDRIASLQRAGTPRPPAG